MLRDLIVDKIIIERKARKLSQEELAEECGLDRTYISSVERKKRNITIDSLEKIIKGLSLPIDKFFKDIKIDGD